MSAIGTLSLAKWAGNKLYRGDDCLEVGHPVKVRSRMAPLAGQSGTILEFAPQDAYGPYLVQFAGGLRFRYRRNELAPTSVTDSAR